MVFKVLSIAAGIVLILPLAFGLSEDSDNGKMIHGLQSGAFMAVKAKKSL